MAKTSTRRSTRRTAEQANNQAEEAATSRATGDNARTSRASSNRRVGQRKRKDEVEKLLDDIKSYRNNEEVLNMIRSALEGPIPRYGRDAGRSNSKYQQYLDQIPVPNPSPVPRPSNLRTRKYRGVIDGRINRLVDITPVSDDDNRNLGANIVVGSDE